MLFDRIKSKQEHWTKDYYCVIEEGGGASKGCQLIAKTLTQIKQRDVMMLKCRETTQNALKDGRSELAAENFTKRSPEHKP